jgi:hypothetical protein
MSAKKSGSLPTRTYRKLLVLESAFASGLHVSLFLSGESFDTDDLVHKVLTPIPHVPIVDVAHKQKKPFILNMNNSPIHKSKITGGKLSQMLVYLALHPLYSPDVAPSDCFCSDT